jgi:hypothetical protein
LAQEEGHSVLDEGAGVDLSALLHLPLVVLDHGWAAHARQLLLHVLVNTGELLCLSAVGTLELQLGDGTIFQRLLGLSLQDGCWNHLLFVVIVRLGGVAVLLGVDAEALRDEVHRDAVDVLNESLNWGEDLLSYVPVNIDS